MRKLIGGFVILGVGQMTAPQDDPVNPQHYKGARFECITFIEAYGFGYHMGSAVAYIARHHGKGGRVDIEKAIWYIERLKGSVDLMAAASATLTRSTFGMSALDFCESFYHTDKPEIAHAIDCLCKVSADFCQSIAEVESKLGDAVKALRAYIKRAYDV